MVVVGSDLAARALVEKNTSGSIKAAAISAPNPSRPILVELSIPRGDTLSLGSYPRDWPADLSARRRSGRSTRCIL
jgi:hypothetical protein